MKTAMFYGGPDIRVEDMARPEPGPGEVLVRVRAAGICGSDLHGYREPRPGVRYPMRSGHELGGAVGLTQGQVARALGAKQVIVIGTRDEPLAIARECGAADAVVNGNKTDAVQAVLDLTGGEGADVVFETVGSHAATVQQAIDLA